MSQHPFTPVVLVKDGAPDFVAHTPAEVIDAKFAHGYRLRLEQVPMSGRAPVVEPKFTATAKGAAAPGQAPVPLAATATAAPATATTPTTK